VTRELKDRIESLLVLADQATDTHNNGLFDREDLVRLVQNFSQLTRALLNDQTRLECDQGDMVKRLQRTPFNPDFSAALPSS